MAKRENGKKEEPAIKKANEKRTKSKIKAGLGALGGLVAAAVVFVLSGGRRS